MFSKRVLAFSFGIALLAAGLFMAAIRIVRLERTELEHESPWKSLDELAREPGATRISARLSEVNLRAGEEALFELCSQDALAVETWNHVLEVAVWEPATQKMELRVPLDEAHLGRVKRAGKRACLPLGGGRVQRTGTYVVDAVWPNAQMPSTRVRETRIRLRVLARQPLSGAEAALVLCAALGALLSVFAAFTPSSSRAERTRRTVLWAFIATVLAAGAGVLVMRVAIPGSIGGLARGLALALLQSAVAVGAAFALYRAPRTGLALHAPEKRAGVWLFAAVGAALVLRPLALLALSLVPVTGEAPIEAFISWPSGALAFAALGMAVPLAEELFFRGFVFGALRPLGLPAAFAVTTLLFASIHAQQTWGNWGALLSVTATGAVLTALRTWSGSTLVPAVTHVLYNLSLWTDSFRG